MIKHHDKPYWCETGGVAVGSSEWLGVTVTYVSKTGREWDAVIVSTHENGHKNPKGETLPLACLEFRNERGKIVRKHQVLPMGWAYWCTPQVNETMVWKPKVRSYPKSLAEMQQVIAMQCISESWLSDTSFRPRRISKWLRAAEIDPCHFDRLVGCVDDTIPARFDLQLLLCQWVEAGRPDLGVWPLESLPSFNIAALREHLHAVIKKPAQ